ncbi:hypothetical protein BpHYR1_007372 [Brachionus plicatilis]|uniref:Uncharacterized protein n=1 Tax=Brachionus plicatilis TaxID=10195 RepID=A0A3M7PJS4_BRAPC|nr:hypothetical protein BpHYR1_007372 [Brachionus plicatilis]
MKFTIIGNPTISNRQTIYTLRSQNEIVINYFSDIIYFGNNLGLACYVTSDFMSIWLPVTTVTSPRVIFISQEAIF